MSFRIDPAKSFDEELQRIGTELIDDAISILVEQPSGPHEAIHDARKKFKRLRALYRFTQKQAPDFRATENVRFRDIARSLSAARDAAALVETIVYLEGFSRSQSEEQALASVHRMLSERRDEIVSHENDLEDRIKTAIEGCREGKKALKKLTLPHDKKSAVKQVQQTVAKQRKTALAALSQCQGDVHDEHFHELRKSGQVHWMHLALLRKLWPSAMRAKKADAKRLVDMLGHEHDLSVLSAFADHEPNLFADMDTLTALRDAITERQQALRLESLELAAHVFAEGPKTESEIIGLLWSRAAK
jgi:CHAD domain-containing protein